MLTYYLSLLHLPTKVAKILDKLICDFFSKGSHGDRGMRSVWIGRLLNFLNWCLVGNFQHHNYALLARWRWRFLTEENASWKKLTDAKCHESGWGEDQQDVFNLVNLNPLGDSFVRLLALLLAVPSIVLVMAFLLFFFKDLLA